jgi:hypothetical protein
MKDRSAFVKAGALRVSGICLLFLSFIWFSGCDADDGSPFVPSLQPLYTKADLESDLRLVGSWKDEDGDVDFSFEKDGEQNYKLTVLEKGDGKQEGGEFDAHLVRLGSERFLDLYPKEIKTGSTFYQLHFLPAHTFVRVEISSDNLTLGFFNSSWLKARIDDKSLDTPHAMADGSILLTGSIEEVQDLAYSYASEDKAFGEPFHLTRQEKTDAQ